MKELYGFVNNLTEKLCNYVFLNVQNEFTYK